MKGSRRRVLIASDHAGLELKTSIQKSLPEWQWEDLGPIGLKNGEKVDYPDFAEKLAAKIQQKIATQGILICGSGIGMSISANKMPGIRAALVENPISARLSREHNDANVLCLGSRFLAPEYGAEIARIWLKTPFSKDGRHKDRVAKIAKLEQKAPTKKA